MQLTLQSVRSIIFKIKRAIMNEEKTKITPLDCTSKTESMKQSQNLRYLDSCYSDWL